MQRRWFILPLLIGVLTLAFSHSARAMSDQEILQELKSLRERIEKLEKEVQAKDEQIKILYHGGSLKDITEASDMLDVSVLSKTVKKYFLCYPK